VLHIQTPLPLSSTLHVVEYSLVKSWWPVLICVHFKIFLWAFMQTDYIILLHSNNNKLWIMHLLEMLCLIFWGFMRTIAVLLFTRACSQTLRTFLSFMYTVDIIWLHLKLNKVWIMHSLEMSVIFMRTTTVLFFYWCVFTNLNSFFSFLCRMLILCGCI